MEIKSLVEQSNNLVKARSRALELEKEWNNILKLFTENSETYKDYQKALLQVADEENKEQEYETLIKNAMLSNGFTEVVKEGLRIKITNTAKEKVNIIDESLISERYFRVKKEVDKELLIKEYRENGVIEKGIDIVKNDSWKLTIKSI